MDSVKRFLESFLKEEKFHEVTFSNKMLNETGDIYGRYGFETTKLYLKGKGGHVEKVMIDLLEELELLKITGEIAVFIIKKLNAIKETKEMDR